ncbi:hypothetical protein MXD63_38660, partial [Frankia sp. Cpl3]|nr:hypothetical protein [Frankia sp. Cpl3]
MNIEDYHGIWVFIEHRDDKIAPVSLELLGAGRKLADKRGVQLAGILIGENVRGLAQSVFQYGGDLVYLYDDPIFRQYRTES